MLKKKMRFSIVSIGLILIVGISVALMRLPAPNQCNERQLQLWLAKKDLQSQSIETRRELVDRFQAELEGGMKVDGNMAELSPKLRDRVEQNISLLQRVWFEHRVAQFHELTTDQTAFLDGQIGLIERWPSEDDELAFFNRINSWVNEAKPDDRKRMNDALAAGIWRWLQTYPLEHRSKAVQDALVRSVDEYLSQGNKAGEFLTETTAVEKKQLLDNSDLLMRNWFGMQSTHFHDLPKDEQLMFVSQKISDLKKWDLQSVTGSEASGSSQWMTLVQKVDNWIEQADSKEKRMLRDFKNAVMKVIMQQFFSSGT